MIYGDACAGISAPTVAWSALGWRCAFHAEVAPFPRAVLRHRWPDHPLRGDLQQVQNGDHDAIDLLVGGTPCQAFSTAGRRQGLDDPRSDLTLGFLALASRLHPRWLVLENVPGLLSIDGGRTFAAVLGILADLGYGYAWRVLDARHFGLAQRRKRLFLVAHLGDWRPPATVLIEPESSGRHLAPRSQAREDVARIPEGGSGNHRTVATLDANYGKLQGASGQDINHGCSHLVAYGGNNTSGPIDVATACNAHGGPHGRLDFESETLIINSGVRRLTPREWERLQGFPDVRQRVTIGVCQGDRCQPHANAAPPCTTDRSSAFGAGESGSPESAKNAGRPSTTSHPVNALPVAVDVLIDYERAAVEISSAGRSIWSASIVGKPSASPLSMPLDAFVRLAALTTQCAARATQDGRAELQPSKQLSSAHQSGSRCVSISGGEIAERAADAATAIDLLSRLSTSTTSQSGPNSQISDSTLRTLCCSVVDAIGSCIPDEIKSRNSYGVSVETRYGYTLIPYRNGMAKDGPRYKAIGNSMPVPVMAWLGRRIAALGL